MSDPQTTNILLSVPTRGSDSGTWDTPVNGNMNSIDGRFGGVVTVSLTNANVTLTKPTGSVVAAGGPTQAENAIILFSGTLSGNCTITFPTPGVYVVRNGCTVGTFYVKAQAAGAGNTVGLPEGRSVKIWNDGTNVDFCDPPEVGSYLDLAMSTTPNWFAACTTLPYLVCDGTVYNISSYPFLGGRLGSTFGGNGSSTFGVPDLRARYRIPLDNQGGSAASRVTSGGSGLNGTSLGAAGGSEFMQQHNHGVTDPGHIHQHDQITNQTNQGGNVPGAVPATANAGTTLDTRSATTNISINNQGSGSYQNIPPALVAGMALIKT